MAVSGIAVAVVIGVTGYMPGVDQTAHTLNAFHGMYTLFSAGIVVLALVPIFFYKLTEKRHAEIMAELADRKAAKKED